MKEQRCVCVCVCVWFFFFFWSHQEFPKEITELTEVISALLSTCLWNLIQVHTGDFLNTHQSTKLGPPSIPQDKKLGVTLRGNAGDLKNSCSLWISSTCVISSANVAFLSSMNFWPMIINLRSRHMTQHYRSGTYYRKKINQEKKSEVQINKKYPIEEISADSVWFN